ncbi:MAG: aspartate/glutamate racemase family protein [Bacteroidales bacterium]|nr:aspartate/glutamate racemase family protein [Bacteroidales bacterium]
MKTIGMIGGVSWESTLEYYRIINQEINNRLGGYHSAKCLIYSVDFAEIEELQRSGRWDVIQHIISNAAISLRRGGADFILICTNTLHKIAGNVEETAGLPLIHIVDATANEIGKREMKKVGLLGTRFTMEEGFYREALLDKFGINVIIPEQSDRETVHKIIFEELCFGVVKESSRKQYIRIINQMADDGAEGVILGCTEIPLLISQNDVKIPVFNTTELHAIYGVDFSLS